MGLLSELRHNGLGFFLLIRQANARHIAVIWPMLQWLMKNGIHPTSIHHVYMDTLPVHMSINNPEVWVRKKVLARIVYNAKIHRRVNSERACIKDVFKLDAWAIKQQICIGM